MMKRLIILMVVVMSAFLLVGCLGDGVTPPVDDVDDDDAGLTTTVAPIITGITGISITSSATQYINKTEASSVVVSGTAPTYSEVKVYIDGVTAGTADVGVTGTFSVVIAKADLGSDGAKVLYATAKEAALDVSAHSVEYAFILDQVAPGIDSVAFTADTSAVITSATLSGATDDLVTVIELSGTTTPVQTFEDGAWVIASYGDGTDTNNISVTSPSGVVTFYTVDDDAVITDTMIPGVALTFASSISAAYSNVTITVTVDSQVSAIAGRATLKFNEDVSYTGAMASTYAGLVTAVPAVYKEANDTGYWTGLTITAYTTYTITVYGVTDLAGNVGGTSTSVLSKSATAGAASATALAP